MAKIKGKQIADSTIKLGGVNSHIISTGDFSLGNYGITTNKTEFGNSEYVNKIYVDSLASGLKPKESCRVATTANITLSGLQAIDGITVKNGDRILVKNQSNLTQNGIYDASAITWQRSYDINGLPDVEVMKGAFTFVESGSTQFNSQWVLSSPTATGQTIYIGVDSLVWIQFGGSGVYNADDLGIEIVGNQFRLKVDNTTIKKDTGVLAVAPSVITVISNVSTSNANISTSVSNLSTSVSTISTTVSTLSATTNNLSTSIGNISTSVSTNSVRISTLSALTHNVSTSLGTISTALSNTNTSLGNVSTSLGNISTSVSTNSVRISTLSALTHNVSTSVVSISTSLANVSTSLGNVSTSLSNVSTSLGNVSTSTANITTSLGNVSTSLGNISTSVSTNTVRISTLSASTANISTSLANVSTSLVNVSTSVLSIATLIGNGLDGSGLTYIDGVLTVNVDGESVKIVGDALRAAAQFIQFSTATNISSGTTGSTLLTLAYTPINTTHTLGSQGLVSVELNGVGYNVDYQYPTTKPFYFTTNPPVAGNLLYFHGVNAGFSLESDDEISISYTTIRQ
jgi:archaellum component FlaC